jgi:hypothetical protein
VDEYVAPCEFLLDEFVELREILGYVLGFHIEKRVDDVVDGTIVLDLLHADCCSDHFIEGGVPVQIDYFLMDSRSRAAEISPKWMHLPVDSWVYILWEERYSCSR